MFASSLVSKYVIAVAVGVSTGGAISYGVDHLRTSPVTAAIPTASVAPAATTSRLGDMFSPVSDALR
jgi:hypothetical protein